MSQKKIGVIFSYASLLASSVLSIILTPFMLRTMGDIEYGLYQTISSFIGVLTILDFGSGVATTKYIAEFNLRNDRKGGNNYLGMAIVVNLIISVVISIIGIGFILSINSVYGNGFTPAELDKARVLAALYIVNMVVTIYANVFQGVVIGYKNFAFANGVQLLKIFFRFTLIFVLLKIGLGAVAISTADIVANFCFLLSMFLYAAIKLKAYPKLVKWDNALFRASLFFSAALFVQAIVYQINNSIDKVLLGSLLGGAAVTIYAIAMNIYLIYGSLSGAIRRILLPDAIKLVSDKADGTAITNFVIEGGRYQFIVLIYILCGFILIGKEFINVWVGKSYDIAYYIAIILMVPTLFQLSQNVTETILDALGKRMIRSVILAIGAAFNVGITIVFIKLFGVIGAPIGTAISCVVASLIILNVYHKKVMDLQVGRMFYEICNRTLLCAVVAMGLCFLINLIKLPNLWALITKGILFSCLYFVFMWLWGFNRNEKAIVRNIIRKIIRRKRGDKNND